MNRPARILSAVDLSESARAAFDHALALSRTHIAQLTVVHAIPKEERFGRNAHERIALIAALAEGLKCPAARRKVS